MWAMTIQFRSSRRTLTYLWRHGLNLQPGGTSASRLERSNYQTFSKGLHHLLACPTTQVRLNLRKLCSKWVLDVMMATFTSMSFCIVACVASMVISNWIRGCRSLSWRLSTRFTSWLWELKICQRWSRIRSCSSRRWSATTKQSILSFKRCTTAFHLTLGWMWCVKMIVASVTNRRWLIRSRELSS